MKYYTGVGSRDTPNDVQNLMREVAGRLEGVGYVLRSGAAKGADTAFESGVSDMTMKEIFLPWEGFSQRSCAEIGVYNDRQVTQGSDIAKEIHPAWGNLSRGVRALHTRNINQVLGKSLDTPSSFLICWAPVDSQGIPKGGTRTAWVCAINNSIPCFNLYNPDMIKRIERWLKNG